MSTCGTRRPATVLAGLGALAVALPALAACGGRSAGGPPDLAVHDARVGETVTNAAALYLRITNGGGEDTLVSVTTAAADRAVLHDSKEIQGGSLMYAVDTIAVPAGGELTFEPGGAHIMLEGVRRPLAEGERVEVELRFDRHPPIALDVPVVALASLVPSGEG